MGTKIFVRAAKKDEIPPGCKKELIINNHPVLLVNLDGQFYALDPVCLHRGGPLSEAALYGRFLDCPWHHWLTDVTNGKIVYPPIEGQVATYGVRVEEESIIIEFPEKTERFIKAEDADKYGAIHAFSRNPATRRSRRGAGLDSG